MTYYRLPEGRVAYFDVDDTLVEWKEPKDDMCSITVEMNGRKLKRKMICSHVQELKRQAEAGTKIIVWSAGGVAWAEACVKALKIGGYVDAILTKPDRYYDDKDVNDWFPKRRFFNE